MVLQPTTKFAGRNSCLLAARPSDFDGFNFDILWQAEVHDRTARREIAAAAHDPAHEFLVLIRRNEFYAGPDGIAVRVTADKLKSDRPTAGPSRVENKGRWLT